MSTTSRIRLIRRGVIEEALTDANVDFVDDTVRTDNQMSTPAFGVTLRDHVEFARFMFSLGEMAGIEHSSDLGDDELRDQLRALVEVVRVDSMGRDLIAYFPGWELSS